MPSQHVEVDDGTDTGNLMVEAQFTTGSKRTGSRWYLCRICGREFPADKVVLKGATAYCIPYKHFLEMKD